MTDFPLSLVEIKQIGERKDRDSAPALVAALGHPDPTWRLAAATALGKVGAASSVPPLLSALTDRAADVRQAAAWALGQIRHNRATLGLLAALNDPDPAVRRAAIWALGQIGARRVLPDLITVSRADPNEAVRRAASAAVDAVGGHKSSMPARHNRQPTPFQGRPTTARSWIIAAALALVALGAGLLATTLAWSQPLGPRLVVPAYDAASLPGGMPPLADLPPIECGGSPTMIVLIVGIDSGEEGYESGFTDVIRVARVDFRRPSAILLAIPRDLWVTIPGLSSYGISENRLKAAYPYGNHYQIEGGGLSLLAQTLNVNMGLTVDHYLAIDFEGFASGIDALGGINVDLPSAVGDPGGVDGYFPAGPQHLNGQQALAYARLRPENSSDLYRIDRQTQVIMAVRDRALSSEGLAGLPSLISSMQAATRTDLSPAQVNSLICVSQKIPRSEITVATLGPSLYVSATDSYGYERLLPDVDAIRQVIRSFMAGDVEAVTAASGS